MLARYHDAPLAVLVDGELAEEFTGDGGEDSDVESWMSRMTRVLLWVRRCRCGEVGVAEGEGALRRGRAQSVRGFRGRWSAAIRIARSLTAGLILLGNAHPPELARLRHQAVTVSVLVPVARVDLRLESSRGLGIGTRGEPLLLGSVEALV